MLAEAPPKIESQDCEMSGSAEVIESGDAVAPEEEQEEGDVAVKLEAETSTADGAVDCVENNCSVRLLLYPFRL